MFRVILPEGDMSCARYERGAHGVEMYTEESEFMAFVPYENLVAIIDADVETGDEPASIA